MSNFSDFFPAAGGGGGGGFTKRLKYTRPGSTGDGPGPVEIHLQNVLLKITDVGSLDKRLQCCSHIF